jgi:hypothetical protein
MDYVQCSLLKGAVDFFYAPTSTGMGWKLRDYDVSLQWNSGWAEL